MNATRQAVVGVDTAKSGFQVYTVEQETGEVINKPIKRAQFLQWFANRASCLVGMEACGGGSVALLIKGGNWPKTELRASHWTDHSCHRRKLVGERHRLGAVDLKLTFADHVHQFNSS